jgi:hypothetical protein
MSGRRRRRKALRARAHGTVRRALPPVRNLDESTGVARRVQTWHGSTERRRSRTYPAVGYTTSPVLKVYLARSVWLRKRGFCSASVQLDPIGSAETGTKSGTKFLVCPRGRGARLETSLEARWLHLDITVGKSIHRDKRGISWTG